MSVRSSRCACVSDSGGLNSATSTASAPTRVKAATWCRKAISAEEYMRPSRLSVIPAWRAPQPFGATLLRLVLEAPLVRSAARPGRPAHLGRDERTADQLGEALLGLAAVALLRAVIARDDEHGTLA